MVAHKDDFPTSYDWHKELWWGGFACLVHDYPIELHVIDFALCRHTNACSADNVTVSEIG